MSENEIKKAFDEIEPEAGAQERMYANILKKAAAQGAAMPEARNDAPAAEGSGSAKVTQLPSRHPMPLWKRYSAMAACLALALTVTLGFLSPFLNRDQEASDPPVMVGSPFEDLDGADGFEKLGFSIDAPEDADNIQYCIVDGEIARVRFSVDDHKYTYEAAKLGGNFSCADGDAVGSAALNAKYDAVLDRLSQDKWRAHWSNDEVSYYLSNFDGAGEEDITDLVQTLISASCE